MAMVWSGDKAEKRLRLWTRRNVSDAVLIVERLVKLSMKKGGRAVGGDLESVGISRISQFSGLRGKRNVQSSARYIDTKTGKRVKKSEIEKRMRKTGSFRSKPGEVPWVQSNRLRGSITTEMHPTIPLGRVGTNVVYGKYLEFGTRRMAPRPFMRPALKKAIPIIQARLAKSSSSMKGPV